MVDCLTAPELASAKGVAHGFFTRQGGVSEGIYASLNAGRGSQDDPDRVAENRRRCVAVLGVDRLATPYQVHGAIALVVDDLHDPKTPPRADAFVTRTPGLAVGVVTADCAPVLLAEPEAGVVAAAHAGWRGALAGILESAVTQMETLGARRSRIRAAIGPTIAQDSYEVGGEVRTAFMAEETFFTAFFAQGARPGKYQFDLEAAVAGCLSRAGVGSVELLAADTYADPERFYSYRRAQHRGESDYGRQLSAIALI